MIGTAGLLEALACVSPCTSQPFEALAELVVRHAGALESCVCVLLDWDEPRRTLVSRLRAHGVGVSVIVIGGAEATSTPTPGPLADQPDRLTFAEPGGVERALAAFAP